MFKLVGEDGKVVSVKTRTDRDEYLACGYYKEVEAEVEVKAEKPAPKAMSVEETLAVANALNSGEKEEVALEDMTMDELKAVYKETFGESKRGNVKAETLIEEIRAAQ